MDVIVESGAGAAAGFPDDTYVAHGARIGSRDDVFEADIVMQVRTCGMNPEKGRDDIQRFRPDQVIAGMADPLVCPVGVQQAADHKVMASPSLHAVSRAARGRALAVHRRRYKAVLLRRPPAKMFPFSRRRRGRCRCRSS
jgi:NAD(P) transhydrogenase subunit alpha